MRIKWIGWSGAVPISESDRLEWAEKAIAAVQDTEGEKDFHNISSGDTLVVAMRYGNRVEVYDCQIRRTGTGQ